MRGQLRWKENTVQLIIDQILKWPFGYVAYLLPLLSVKQAIAILLFVCSLCQCMVKLSIVAWYEYNKQYIAANLCENRDKPQMKCCGKCYLNKQLKKADKSDEAGRPGPQSKNQWADSSPFIVPEIAVFTSRPFISSSSVLSGFYRPMALQEFTGAVFHPPQAGILAVPA